MTKEDDIHLMKWTIALEAEGEPFQGKLGVAFVLVNRKEKWNQSIVKVCFSPFQFECWGKNDQKLRLSAVSDSVMLQCERVARLAYNHEVPDPTNGALYYMNEELVVQRAGFLPGWWRNVVKTVKIGQHQFAKDP